MDHVSDQSLLTKGEPRENKTMIHTCFFIIRYNMTMMMMP